jgi:hypothetical protein
MDLSALDFLGAAGCKSTVLLVFEVDECQQEEDKLAAHSDSVDR